MSNTVDTDAGQQPLTVDSIPLEALPYYEGVVRPTIGEANIIEGWRLTENAGLFRGVRGLIDATVGDQVTQDVVSGAPAWPRTARITQSVFGDVIDCGDPPGGEFDFGSDIDFAYVFWVRGDDNAVAQGVLSKRDLANIGPGITISWRTDVSPDQIQFLCFDATLFAQKSVVSDVLHDDTWHHYVCAHDGTLSQMRMWIDAVEQGAPVSTAALGTYANSLPLLIGNAPGSLQVIGAFVAHFYILSIVPSQDQIDALFAGGP